MKTKMTAIFAILMIALMLAGVSYALWSKTIYIEGTVNTGDVDAEFGDTRCTASLDMEGLVPVPAEKMTFTFECHPDELDPQILHVVITDLYPSIWIHCYFEIWNTGTVPWIVNSAVLTSVDFPGDVIFTPIDLVGTQVEPGYCTEADLEIHLTNEALENSQYPFDVEIEVVHWNEYPV